MNCKQGDLAIVVRSPNGRNFGKVVRCVRWVGRHPEFVPDDMWETDAPLESTYREDGLPAGLDCLASDSYLRPLRGDLLDKETESTKELERVD